MVISQPSNSPQFQGSFRRASYTRWLGKGVPLFARLATQSRLLSSISLSERVYALFDAAFSLLKREGYRHEYIYKAALTHKILLGKHSLQTASMMNEFRVGECKADVAILNGTATVYEVKSERDSLSRLERQVAAYATVFAKVYVIAAESHVRAVPIQYRIRGDLSLNRRHHISTLRDAADQPERTCRVRFSTRSGPQRRG